VGGTEAVGALLASAAVSFLLLHALAQFYQRRSENQLAFLFADAGQRIPPPPDGALFVEAQVYDWRLTDIVAVSLYSMGHPDEAATLNRRLLEIVPEDTRSRIQTNLEFCETAPRGFESRQPPRCGKPLLTSSEVGDGQAATGTHCSRPEW
jgi:hypothetical protein